MKKITSFTALILILSIFFSLLPMGTAAEEALSDEKPDTKAVSVSSISVPAYSGGTASSWMVYDGGGSVSFHDGSSDSKMQIIKGTTATQFNTYCTKLTNNGYTKVWSRTLAAQSGSNRYAKFLSPDGTYSVYTYFVPYTSQTRIIVDTHRDTVEGFSYHGTGTGTTEVYMYGLTAPDNGYSYTASDLGIQRRFPAGSMFVIKMPDNSLFIIDGGHKVQASERALEDLYNFCREITGLPQGQKMVISAWHLSHIHTDHVQAFSRFLTKYSHEFELHNIIYNTDLVEADSTKEQALNQVAQLFPNARYYKPHTGERFTIAGVTFDVLYAVEDWYKPNSSNKLIQRDADCLTYSNDNNASMALRMCFDGKSALWLGDLEKADAVLMGMYPTEDIKSDILQLPHHLLDDHTTLVKTLTPTIAFANQSKQGAYTRGKVFNYVIKIDSLTDIYYSGNQTVGYRADQGIFYEKDHVEFEYGNWGLRTYDIRDGSDYTSEPVKAAEQYYRYTRVKDLKEGQNAYAIVDHTTEWVMSFDAINGGASKAMPAHYLNDTFYFADSQRRLVNWQIQYSQYGTNDNSIIPNYGNYFGTVTINKGSGDYWGTPKKNTGMYLGYNDTFQSAGMYSSWCAFSNQLEANSKGIWIDQTAGSTFLIYRYDNGTYYPLYRDGDVLADNGWGVAKLTTHSQARSKCHYLKNRLYFYNATPSDMYLTVTGHSDYYVYPGVPSSEIISHITSDLRVNFTLPAFGATGEITYDAAQTKEVGTYYLEFTKTLAPNTVGDYPVVIKYINPNGTVQELGRLTVHVEARNLLEDGGAELFFGFSDDPVDKLRYRLEPQYNYFNFDSDKRWTAAVYDNDNKKYTASSYEVNPHEGTMNIVMEDKTATRKTVTLDLFADSQFPLKYDPQYAEVIQIRFKMENMKSYSTYNPFVRLWYYGADQVRHFDVAHYFGTNFTSDGEYMTLTLDLFTQADVDANASVSGGPTMRLCDMDEISSIRLGFYYFMVNDSGKNGEIIIDHIYIGPRDGVPTQEASVLFDFDNSAEAQLRYQAESYKGLNFDLPVLPAWATKETSTAVSVYNDFTIDNQRGVAVIPVAEGLAYGNTTGLYGPWFVTAPVNGVYPYAADPAREAISYDPTEAEYVQFRFKVDGCTTVPEKPTQVVVVFDRTVDGVTARGGYQMAEDYTLQNGAWVTMTIPVSQEFANADYITTLGMRFSAIKAVSAGSGQVTLDYLYAGPRAELPADIAIVRFTAEDGSLLQTSYVAVGTEAVFNGAEPVKPKDENGEWHFVGWMDETGNLVDLCKLDRDVTLKPAFSQEPQINETLKIYHSLNLASDISINYVVSKADLEGYENISLYCTLPEYEGNTQIGMSTVQIQPVENGDYYYFTLAGLTAVRMGDMVEAVLHMTQNGAEYFSLTDIYSVASYAYGMLDSTTDAKMLTLCANLLRYGAEAQSFKKYRTDALVDADMTGVHKAYLGNTDTLTFTATDSFPGDLTSPKITWVGKTLDLGSKVGMKFVCSTANYGGDVANLSMKVSYEGSTGEIKTVTLTGVEVYNAANSYYSFTFYGLLASELRTVVDVAIFEGDTQLSETLRYSAESYASKTVGTALEPLTRALFAYSDSAKAFFAK